MASIVIGPFMVCDQPLTAAQIETLRVTAEWTFATLSDFTGRPIVPARTRIQRVEPLTVRRTVEDTPHIVLPRAQAVEVG